MTTTRNSCIAPRADDAVQQRPPRIAARLIGAGTTLALMMQGDCTAMSLETLAGEAPCLRSCKPSRR